MKKETIYVLLEPETRNSFWIDNILQGMLKTAMQFKDTVLYTDPRHLRRLGTEIRKKSVMLVSNHEAWIRGIVDSLLRFDAEPVIVNACTIPALQSHCSSVVFGIEAMITECLSLLKGTGKRRVALLGPNPLSVTDQAKCAAFGRKEDIVFADGTIEDCVARFADTLPETRFDGAVCANDTVAICLVRALLGKGYRLPEEFPVIGMGNSYLGANLALPLTTVSFDYHQMGGQAVHLFHILQSHPLAGHVTLSLPCELILRASTPSSPSSLAPGGFPPDPADEQKSRYFSGGSAQAIIRAENMLQAADPVDREILLSLMHGETGEEIAARMFLTSRAVRYRIANLINRYGFSSRGEMIQSLQHTILWKEEEPDHDSV